MEIRDHNGNLRKWNRVREKEFSSGKVQDLNKENSKTAIDMLKDFEIGVNTTTKGKRGESSLLRNRMTLRMLGKAIKNKPFSSVTREQLTKVCNKNNSEDFCRNVKVIFNWMFRTQRIKENVGNHLVPNDFSKGKPEWVFLKEEEMKLLINSANTNYRALICLLYDSGARCQEAWRLRVMDFQDNFTVLNIPKKRRNGEAVSKTFERTIKLKYCSQFIKEYVELNKLKDEDMLINITQAGFNKYMRHLCKRLFGDGKSKAGERYDKITVTDIRHNSSCFWHVRYKTNRELMYRMGWIKENKVFYYSEFLNLRDTIDDEDLITTEDKNKYETELQNQGREIEQLKRAMVELVKQNSPQQIQVGNQQGAVSVSGLSVQPDKFISFDK